MRIAQKWGKGMSWLCQMLAVTLIVQMAGFAPADVHAQTQVYCGIFGVCTGGANTGAFLGLPDGTLVVKSYRPWDRVVKGQTASDWEALEAEARGTIAAIHGVPNDERLPYNAIDQIRAIMLARLLGLAERSKNGQTLSSVESRTLAAFQNVIRTQKVAAAQNALNEYHRWQNDPCGYQVPSGFGFEVYDPGPVCKSAVPNFQITGPPRPPTAQQFTGYGAALANVRFQSADAQASYQRMLTAYSALGAMAGGVLLGTLAVAVSVALPAVGFAMLGVAGSTATIVISASSFSAYTAAVGLISGISVGGPIAIAVIALAVTVAGTVAIAEDSAIPQALSDNLQQAGATPDLAAMAGTSEGASLLVTAFANETLPDYESERLSSFPPPSGPGASDPVFSVNGNDLPVIDFVSSDGRLWQAFMSDGWFVVRSRADANANWGNWQWSLTIEPGTGHLVGIQPAGFTDVDYLATTPHATSAASFVADLGPLGRLLVARKGNHAPRVTPTSSGVPALGQSLTFQSGAVDPDGDPLQIRWFFEDPAFNPLFPDVRACSFNTYPTGFPGNDYQCPWTPVDDPGTGVQRTYSFRGAFNVRVLARDSKGAETSQQFVINIPFVSPTLTVNTPPPSVTEGSPLTISGTFDYPSTNGLFDQAFKLFVDFGDGTVVGENFPCEVPYRSSDLFSPCPSQSGNTGVAGGFLYSGTPAPWQFSFSHAYTAGASSLPVMPVKVWAETYGFDKTRTELFPVTLTNIKPTFAANPNCSPIACNSSFSVLDVVSGGTVHLRGFAEDVPGANLSAQVFWGDGTTSTTNLGTSTTSLPPGVRAGTYSLPVDLSHTYLQGGTYTISLIVNDGGPGGATTFKTTAHAYGLGPILGAGAPGGATSATYTYTFTAPPPPNAPPFTPNYTTPVANCGSGTVASQATGSFTCDFPDVAVQQSTSVGVSATVFSANVTQSLPVVLTPIQLALNAFTIPSQIPSGVPVHFGVSYTKASYAVQVSASCYSSIPTANGVINAIGVTTNVTGSGFDCTFPAYPSMVPGVVSVSVADAFGHVVGSTQNVNVGTDTVGPVLTLPANIVTSSTNSSVPMAFTATALDAVTGPATVVCTPPSGSSFPTGVTTVNCSATDGNGNTSSGSFTVTVNLVSSAADVTQSVGITYGGFTLNRATGRFVQTLTLRNNASLAIAGPLSVALSGLSSNAVLYQPAGSTVVYYAGSPYRTIPVTMLASGATATITLEFTKTGTAGITYTGKVIAGQGTR